MKQSHQFTKLLLAAALALGFAPAALHAAENTAPAGLLGQRYATAGFGIIDLGDSSLDVHSYRLAYNQDVAAGVDARLELDYLRSQPTNSVLYGHQRYTDRNAVIGARAFTRRGTVTPYAELGAGWTWFKLADWREDSFLWFAGVGAEFAVNGSFVVAPYVRYTDRVDLFRGHSWNYGMRANYALTAQLALTATLDRDDDQDMEYQLGLAWRF